MSQANRPHFIYKELWWRKRLNTQLVLLLGKMCPFLMVSGVAAWGKDEAGPGCHGQHRIWKQLIRKLPSRGCLNILYTEPWPWAASSWSFSVSARKAACWPHEEAVIFYSLWAVSEKVTAPGHVWRHLRSVMSLCTFMGHSHWPLYGLQYRVPAAALSTGTGQQWSFNGPRRNGGRGQKWENRPYLYVQIYDIHSRVIIFCYIIL